MMKTFALGTITVMAVGVAATNCQAVYAGEWEYAGVFYEGQVERYEAPFQGLGSHDATSNSANWQYTSGEWEVRGSSGYSQVKGRARWKYRWKRDHIYQYDPNTGVTQWVPDPNDDPPADLWLIVTLSAGATALSSTETNYAYKPRDPSKESAYANIEIQSVPPYSQQVGGADNGQLTEANAALAEFVRVPTNGQEEVFGPWGVIDTKGALEGDRTYPGYPGYPKPITGEVYSKAEYGAPFANFRLIEPDPAGNPLLGQNEYTMMGSGAPFIVPTRTAIASLGINEAVLEAIKSGSYWELSRSLPNALAGIENGYVYNIGTQPQSGAVFPRFRSDIGFGPDPSQPSVGAVENGLGFSTKNGLPDNNSYFGARNVDYYFNNIYFQFAPIEVFYPSTAQTHPVGNTKFCAKNSNGVMAHWQSDYLLSNSPFKTATPNWFHYYSQAWSSPVPITYDDAGFVKTVEDQYGNVTQTNTGQSYYGHSDANHPGDNHLHISRDAHGEYDVALYERRNFYLGVSHVGYQKQYGIDNFVGTIMHEYTHKRCDEAIQSGMLDSDGDGVPDDWENAVGLNPNDANSAAFPGASAQEYEDIADQEVYCAIQARDANGPREADWADDGLNKGTVPGPDPANRNLKSYFYQP